MKTIGWILTAMICISSQASGQTSLTVYNNNLAVVRHTVDMDFTDGQQTVTYAGVPVGINPTSVRLNVAGGDVTVLEQRFRHDFAASMNLLRDCLNRRITIWLDDDGMVEGTLLSVASDVIVRGGNGLVNIIKANAIERYELPDLPDELVAEPTLSWLVNSRRAGTRGAEISYITSGLEWYASYTAVIGDDEDSLDLSAWVSINNYTGVDFDDASLKIMAGTLNNATPRVPKTSRAMPQMLMMEDAGNGFSGFQGSAISEYHLYKLGRTADIPDGVATQISLFEPATVKARKLYNYDMQRNPGQVAAVMELTNSERAGLGMPLPQGTVRVYTRDTDGALELVGEDSISHTARDEDVKVTMGYAFDLAAERRVTDTNRISQRIQDQAVEISLRNRTDEDVEITVTEHLYGDWEIMTSSDDYTKKDATTLEFTVDVPAGGETVVSYTARIQ